MVITNTLIFQFVVFLGSRQLYKSRAHRSYPLTPPILSFFQGLKPWLQFAHKKRKMKIVLFKTSVFSFFIKKWKWKIKMKRQSMYRRSHFFYIFISKKKMLRLLLGVRLLQHHLWLSGWLILVVLWKQVSQSWYHREDSISETKTFGDWEHVFLKSKIALPNFRN